MSYTPVVHLNVPFESHCVLAFHIPIPQPKREGVDPTLCNPHICSCDPRHSSVSMLQAEGRLRACGTVLVHTAVTKTCEYRLRDGQLESNTVPEKRRSGSLVHERNSFVGSKDNFWFPHRQQLSAQWSAIEAECKDRPYPHHQSAKMEQDMLLV